DTDTPRAAKPEPCSLVVFGASGDLTHRLLLPALYNLARGGLLPDAFSLVGVARSPVSDDAFRDDLAKALRQFATGPIDDAVARKLIGNATYVQGDADDPVSFARLGQALQQSEAVRQVPANRLYYLATPPSAFT